MWLHVPRELLSASVPEPEGSTLASPAPAEWSLWCTSSGTPTQQPASWPGWKRRPWHQLLSGTTCAPSTLARGVALWISWLEARLARISPLPGSALGSMGSAPGSSSSTCGSPSSARPPSSSGRTSPEQLGLFPASVSTSKSEATEASGPSFVRVTLEPLTSEPGSSSWPTPRASPNENRTTRSAPTHGNGHGETLAGVACDWGRENLWPTASARDWKSGEHSEATAERNARPLNEAAWSWARTHLAALTSKDGPECLRYDPTLHRLCLNPAFVEWLMGWEDGWTRTHAQTGSGSPGTVLCQSKPLTLGADSGERSSTPDAARTEAA